MNNEKTLLNFNAMLEDIKNNKKVIELKVIVALLIYPH